MAPIAGRRRKKRSGLKRSPLDEFTRLAGRRRKPAVRLLNARTIREVLSNAVGWPVKLKPEKSVRRTAKGSGFTPART
jgi:hypothetical protein